jgi:hypothetical protein
MDDVLKINGQVIDIDNGIPMPINFELADVKEPEKRKRNISKSISIPLTQRNLDFFYSAYSLSAKFIENQLTIFNYDARATYITEYYKDGILVFNGYSQLLNIKTNKGINYAEIVLFSDVLNVFKQLENITLPNLGWSEYDHQLTHGIILQSWDATVIKNGAPVSNFSGGNPDGFGYLYPLIDYGFDTLPRSFADNDIFPHVYYWEIFKKSFDLLGFTISSSFINSVTFKKFIIGYGGGSKFTVDASQISDRQVDITADYDEVIPVQLAQINNSFVVQGSSGIPFVLGNIGDVSVTENTDTLNQFEPTQGTLTIANTGDYRITMSAGVDVELLVTTDGTLFSVSANVEFIVILNGITIGGQNINVIGTTPTTLNFGYTIDRYLFTGDVLEYRMILRRKLNVTGATTCTFDIDLDFNNSVDFDLTFESKVIVNGDNVILAQYLPNLTMKDFLLGVIRQFNLYISEPNQNGVVTIEPLSTYFLGTNNVDDYTKKIDYDKEVMIEPLAIKQPKRYVYRYAEDRDMFKLDYFTKFGIDYGDYIYENPSFYANGDSAFTLPYAMSVPVELNPGDPIIPRIFQQDGTSFKPYKGKARVYVYEGKMAYSPTWTLRHTDGGADTVLNVYPRCGHLDSLTAPTIDLCFGTVSKVYYTATNYTTKNLFNLYYNQFIREVTSADSKMLTAYFRLNYDDIKGQFFRKLKLMDGQIYRLNKIVDFNLNQDDSVLVELIKVIEAKGGKSFALNYIDAISNELAFGDLDFTPDDSPPPAPDGKVRLTVDTDGLIKITDDSGVTKSATGVKYEFDGTVSQTGAASPTIDSIGINTFTITNAASRTGVGTYRLTGTGAFAGTVTIQITNGDYAANEFYIEAKKVSNDAIEIRTYDGSGLQDGILKDASINIKVY